MVTSPVAMVPFVEAVVVVVFTFVLPPEMESSFSFMASAVFIMGDMIVWFLSAIRNLDVFLLKRKDMYYCSLVSMKIKGVSNHWHWGFWPTQIKLDKAILA